MRPRSTDAGFRQSERRCSDDGVSRRFRNAMTRKMIWTGVAPYGLFRALLPRPQACSVPLTGARTDSRREQGHQHNGTEIQSRRQRPRRAQGRTAYHSLQHQRAGLRQRRRRRDAERARHSLHLAQSGRELSRPARLASSTSSATSSRRCCCACTRRPPSRSRTATPRSPARRWPPRCIPTSGCSTPPWRSSTPGATACRS